MKIITCQNVPIEADKIKSINKFEVEDEYCISVNLKDGDIKEFFFDSYAQKEITYQLIMHELTEMDKYATE